MSNVKNHFSHPHYCIICEKEFTPIEEFETVKWWVDFHAWICGYVCYKEYIDVMEAIADENDDSYELKYN